MATMRVSRRLALAAAGVSAGLLTAYGVARPGDLEFLTGQTLYADCSAKPGDADYATRSARCVGYVMGVSDAEQALQGAGATQRVCLPPTASAGAMAQVVARYLADHADKRPTAAQDLVIEALGAEYPCH